MNLVVTGDAVKSRETMFGNLAVLIGEIEAADGIFGPHVTMGGFPMKAWMKKDGVATELHFSSHGVALNDRGRRRGRGQRGGRERRDERGRGGPR